MTQIEKLKELGYQYSEKNDCWFKLDYFVKIIDLTCYEYKLDVGVIHFQYEADNIKHLFEEVKADFRQVIECEEDNSL